MESRTPGSKAEEAETDSSEASCITALEYQPEGFEAEHTPIGNVPEEDSEIYYTPPDIPEIEFLPSEGSEARHFPGQSAQAKGIQTEADESLEERQPLEEKTNQVELVKGKAVQDETMRGGGTMDQSTTPKPVRMSRCYPYMTYSSVRIVKIDDSDEARAKPRPGSEDPEVPPLHVIQLSDDAFKSEEELLSIFKDAVRGACPVPTLPAAYCPTDQRCPISQSNSSHETRGL